MERTARLYVENNGIVTLSCRKCETEEIIISPSGKGEDLEKLQARIAYWRRHYHDESGRPMWDAPDTARRKSIDIASTFNKFGVGVMADWIVMLAPPSQITRADALMLAAWLVALADDGERSGFEASYTAVIRE